MLRLAYDMVDTMRNADGVGLAANQVGELRRIIVIQLPEEEEARIYFNPEITHREGERRVEEGCLSIAGYTAYITRSVLVKFRALDDSAVAVRIKAEDLLAQALEHEVDHLNGILYIDHMASHEKLIKVKPPAAESDANLPASDDNANADTPPSSDEQHGGADLWLPSEDDGRNTPASLKVK